jgi:hypothetical protein
MPNDRTAAAKGQAGCWIGRPDEAAEKIITVGDAITYLEENSK